VGVAFQFKIVYNSVANMLFFHSLLKMARFLQISGIIEDVSFSPRFWGKRIPEMG